MLFIQGVKVLFAILVLNITAIEMKSNGAPLPQSEDYRIDEPLSSIGDDTPINADSFPVAPDIQDAPRMDIIRD